MKEQNTCRSVSFRQSASLRVFAVALLLLGTTARGGDPVKEYHVDLSSLGYGSVSQTTDGIRYGNIACGPTAAINSFFFLQNHHGFTTLGPGNGLLTETNVVDAVNEIGTLMNLDPFIGGVTIQSFITGKKSYLTQHGLGNQIGVEWQSEFFGGTIPTWSWLYRQLKAEQDVEIAFTWLGTAQASPGGTNGGHMVTLTSFDFTDFNGNNLIDRNEATLDFIDPYGGDHLTAQIEMDGAYMDIYYEGGGALNGSWGRIHSAVAESPIPEPSTYGLLGAACLICGIVVSRIRRKR